MKRGNSGATISITNRGVVKCGDPGKGLLEQAAMCERLYPVTPRVLNTHSSRRTEYYVMEDLNEPDVPVDLATDWACGTIASMKKLLHDRVWTHDICARPGWNTSLLHWLAAFNVNSNFYAAMLEELFIRRSIQQTWSWIHGDPTLANVLLRNDSTLVIADPIPPKGKIPSHITVDLGKMLQSAIGWETVSFGWKYDTETVVEEVLRWCGTITKARAWFWAAIHCLRIVPYTHGNTLIGVWAEETAARCISICWRTLCSTLSTSTEHSLTQGKRY